MEYDCYQQSRPGRETHEDPDKPKANPSLLVSELGTLTMSAGSCDK